SDILFKFFNGLKYTIHSIPLKCIINNYTVEEGNGQRTILFIHNCGTTFKTFNWKTGFRRDWPSYESIQNHSEALLLLGELTKDNPKKLIYVAKIASKRSIRIFQTILLFIVCIMTLNLIDLYLLPKEKINDH